ncbi:CPBP family intramembrane glutamic endopeptidase [Tenacibaculum sp. 190524A02b]|uniref:CPBP family intramembrane glutamic endopeptidase n=1 Tax=Tenacibaculum vairaonense TaxID=3137860 RepID=UPI0031FABE33
MDIHIILIYGALLLSVISTWIPYKLFKQIPLWLFFLTISFSTAITFKVASLFSLAYTLIFGVSVYSYYKQKNFLLFFIVLALAIPLMLHNPELGFNNYQYLSNLSLTSDSVPYNLYFNLDKTLIGIFVIAFSVNYIKFNISQILRFVLLFLFFKVLLFFALAIILGYSKFEPKLPYFTPIWGLVNLFSTCLAEEALFRGVIQQKISSTLKGKYASMVSILIASLLFGIAHYKGGFIYVILATVAGGFYGYIYYKTKRIESSILLHFAFNFIHFLFFTYPALK